MRASRAGLLTVPAAMAVLLGAAGPGAAAAQPGARATPAPLRTFSSCTSLVRFARAQVRDARRASGGPLPPAPPPAPMPTGAPERGDEAVPVAAAPPDVSTTNVQEAGVDEPDLVKTDGERIFAVARGRLHAIEARGDAPRLLGSVPLGPGAGHELLLFEGRALVVSRAAWEPAADTAPGQGGPITTLTEVDVRVPSAMRVVRTLRADGHFVSARRTGPTARVVLSAPPEVSAADAAAVRRAPLAAWLPGGVVRTERTGQRRGRRLVDCSAVRRPRAFSGLGILTVLTIDLRRGLPWVDSDAVMTDAQVVYGSPESLYVATQAWDAAERPSSTQIHRFAAAGAPDTAYRATGTVPGVLLNQFSLSEHGGVLRAASTREAVPVDGGERPESESVVTVLAQDGSVLRPVGSVGGLGRGERIYAVRFLGDVGYVVTFRETDPLYTLDLTTPSAPRVAGELKIRGYSAYLHPVGENLLLGVGQDATDEGRTLGTQLSLFDVSRPQAPVRLHQRTLGAGGSSEAEYDHHAFLHWAPAQLAVLPFAGGEPGTDGFAGAAGFRVDPAAGIEEVGRVEHGGADGAAPIRRSLVIADRLFTLSDRGVLASDLATLAPRTWVPFGG